MSVITGPVSAHGTPVQMHIYPRPLLGVEDPHQLPSLPQKIFSHNLNLGTMFPFFFSGNTYILIEQSQRRHF